MNRYGYKTSLKSKFVDLFRGSKLYKGQFALQQSESATSGKIVEVKGQQQETPQKDCTQLTEESDLVESQEGQPSSLSDDTDTGRFYFQFIDPISHNVYLEAKRKGEGSILGRYTDGFKMGTETRTGGREAFYEVLKQILTHHGAVDFHCKGGIHRTGMVGLMIRYLQGGEWTKELTQPFHTTAKRGNLLKKDLALQLRNEAEKEYRDHNPNNFRQENLQTIRELSQDSLFECLKTEFSPYLNADSLEPVKTQCIRNGAYSEASTTNRDLPDDLSEKMRSEMWKKCWDQHNKELSISVEIDHLEGLLEKYQLEFSKKGKLEKLKALLKKDTQKELLKEKITQLYSKIRDRVFHSSTDISEHRLEVLKNRFCSFKKQIPPLKPPEFTSIMGAVGDNCASYGAP